MREGIQGPLANCSLFSQTVFLTRWTVSAEERFFPVQTLGRGGSGRGATHSDPIAYPAQDGTGSGDECVSARHRFVTDCVSRAGRHRFGDRMRGGESRRRPRRRPRRRNAAGAKVPRYSRQCYCCARQRFIFMWRRTKYVASRTMIAASTTSTAVISGLCPNIPTVNVLEEFASV